MIKFSYRGDPRRCPVSDRPEFTELLGELRQLTGLDIEPHPSVDFEDWTECALQLRAVLEQGVEVEIFWTDYARSIQDVLSVGTKLGVFSPGGVPPEPTHPESDEEMWDDEERDIDFSEQMAQLSNRPKAELITHVVSGSPCPTAFMGALSDHDKREAAALEAVWPRPEDRTAQRYGETLTFQNNAGRRIAICDMPGGDPEFPLFVDTPLAGTPPQTSLTEALTNFEGCRVAVKQTWPLKAMNIRYVDVSTGGAGTAARDVFAEDPFHVMRFEGDRNALLVQDAILMTHETRYFIVDGVPVSGAGCVEAHTPLDRDPNLVVGVTHSVFEEKRNDGVVIQDAAAAAALDEAARVFARQLHQEVPDMRFVVMDLALGADGQPLIIELNPYQNSGLYANDPVSIFTPVVDEVRNPRVVASPEPF